MSYRVTSGDPASFGRRQPYTVEAGKRHFRIRPWALWSSAALVCTLGLWSAGTASYFAFRDNIMTGMLARQGEMQRGYEDRIADLRGQLERMSSRQLLDQEQLEKRIESLVRRQSTLETRASALNLLPEGSAPAAPPQPRPARDAGEPSPLPPPATPTVLDRQSSMMTPAASEAQRHARGQRIAAKLARLEEALDRTETDQNARLLALEDRYGATALRLRGVLAEIGLDLRKIAPVSPQSGLGGPFVPVGEQAPAGAFEHKLLRVQHARSNLDRLSRTLALIPLRRPVSGTETSSGFGVRLDPFFRSPALHSGLDFRAAAGEPVRATAAGKVVTAGWSGGYGRMVEIDHGNGLSTRYGHLSSILVDEDQMIKPGQVVGRVGSTGRSTGPHLHYETRIDGEAVDPTKFLRAGRHLDEKL